MLMRCKTCSKEFVPPRKNVLNCSKCIMSKKAKNKGPDDENQDDFDGEENPKKVTKLDKRLIYCDTVN